jgi:hypothetical protein
LRDRRLLLDGTAGIVGVRMFLWDKDGIGGVGDALIGREAVERKLP